MAGLTLKDLRKGRVTTFVMKMEEGVKTGKAEYMFTKMDGRKVNLKILSYKPSGATIFYDITKHKKQILDLLSGTGNIPNLKFTDVSGNDTLALSDIMKTEEFGGKANKGDMAEIIFSAAVTARFLKRGKLVQVDDVINILKKMNDTQPKQTYKIANVENDQKGVYDELYWSFAAPLITVKTLAKPASKKSKDILALVNSSLLYVNSDAIRKTVESTGKNNQKNKIEVMAVGTLAQKETKVDVKVLIDGKPTNINMSVKTKGTKQVGQVGGGGYKKQQELWKNLVGLDVPKNAISAYTKQLSKGTPAAIQEIYASMVVLLNSKFANINDPIYEKLATGIKYYATKKDPTVEMIQLGKDEAMLWQFNGLKTAVQITNSKLMAELVTASGMPKINIKENGRKTVLISIRLKKDNSDGEAYYRNYVEKGPAMTKFATILN